MKKFAFATALMTLGLAQPALAQDEVTTEDDRGWTGVYAGAFVARGVNVGGQNEQVLFDTNGDGVFGDRVLTGTGANAFASGTNGAGFCGGRAITNAFNGGCREEKSRMEYGAHVGFDNDLGGLVLGVLAEYRRSNVRDSVTAFSSTPANYVLTRRMKDSIAVRGRAGVHLTGSTLAYGTAGVVFARVQNSFSSSNVANAFDASGTEDAFGSQYGLGIEQRFGRNFSVGFLFLNTNVDADDARVVVTQGTAPATNPFISNPTRTSTTFRRGDQDFETRSFNLTASFRF